MIIDVKLAPCSGGGRAIINLDNILYASEGENSSYTKIHLRDKKVLVVEEPLRDVEMKMNNASLMEGSKA